MRNDRGKGNHGENQGRPRIYDCIADNEKSFELYIKEMKFCDEFIERHVVYPTQFAAGTIFRALALKKCMNEDGENEA
jgi:hypothetical protein